MITSIFKICDEMIKSCDIDYGDLKSQNIKNDFFEDYTNTRLVNSFFFNFAKLQDKIGAKLFRQVLYDLKEIDDKNLPMIDILNILEKLEILEDLKDWDTLREIRNSLAHEYPFDIEERIENIKLAIDGYKTLKEIYKGIVNFYQKNNTLFK
ncbi:hypothetical protein JHD49_01320 [Sulfurimonas sp. SAG-AH-194-C21]|nr:hypothetical protein [Sulfurimonas sp. SAG-AH-194-C21]MDF1882574.1 hypothetical protein [Sulfurimonas sp. SAG-AH-194-C21]